MFRQRQPYELVRSIMGRRYSFVTFGRMGRKNRKTHAYGLWARAPRENVSVRPTAECGSQWTRADGDQSTSPQITTDFPLTLAAMEKVTHRA